MLVFRIKREAPVPLSQRKVPDTLSPCPCFMRLFAPYFLPLHLWIVNIRTKFFTATLFTQHFLKSHWKICYSDFFSRSLMRGCPFVPLTHANLSLPNRVSIQTPYISRVLYVHLQKEYKRRVIFNWGFSCLALVVVDVCRSVIIHHCSIEPLIGILYPG